MPIRYLFCDEVDEYPADVDGQGDPIVLAEKRMTGPMFTRRKVFLASTPTVKGLSRIEREFLSSDQQRYHVPCPHCGHMDYIRWENIKYTDDDPTTAALVCVECGCFIEEHHKTQMLAEGEWRPTGECPPDVIGFHIPSFYSPLGWFPWSAIVREFLTAKKKNDPLFLKTWVNTVLAETWEERGEEVEPEGILERAESYPAQVPHGVGVLVAAVDVQDDRLEIKVKGYGASEESWLIAYEQLYGDPGKDELWYELDRFRQQKFKHESGAEVEITCTTVDSGGHHTEQVYRYCKAREKQRVFAIRGTGEHDKPLVGRPSDRNRYRTKLFNLCVDTGKAIVLRRLRIETPGPGYCHMPDFIDEEYVAQLTAERAVWKHKKNKPPSREWLKTRERNEAFDLEVYCLAALYILGPSFIQSLPQRAHQLSKGAEQDSDKKAGRKRRRPRRNRWIDGAVR